MKVSWLPDDVFYSLSCHDFTSAAVIICWEHQVGLNLEVM